MSELGFWCNLFFNSRVNPTVENIICRNCDLCDKCDWVIFITPHFSVVGLGCSPWSGLVSLPPHAEAWGYSYAKDAICRNGDLCDKCDWDDLLIRSTPTELLSYQV